MSGWEYNSIRQKVYSKINYWDNYNSLIILNKQVTNL